MNVNHVFNFVGIFMLGYKNEEEMCPHSQGHFCFHQSNTLMNVFFLNAVILGKMMCKLSDCHLVEQHCAQCLCFLCSSRGADLICVQHCQ